MFVFERIFSREGGEVWSIQAHADDPVNGELFRKLGHVVADESGHQVVDIGQLIGVLDSKNDMLHFILAVTAKLPERFRNDVLFDAHKLLGRHVSGTGASFVPGSYLYDVAETWRPPKLNPDTEGGIPDA